MTDHRKPDEWAAEMETMIDDADDALVAIVAKHAICPACFVEALIAHLSEGLASGRIVHQRPDYPQH